MLLIPLIWQLYQSRLNYERQKAKYTCRSPNFFFSNWAVHWGHCWRQGFSDVTSCLCFSWWAGFFHPEAKSFLYAAGRWLPEAPGLLNHTLITTWREVYSLKFVCLSEGDSDSCILCLAAGPISVSGRTCYYFLGLDWILFSCLLPGRKRRYWDGNLH